MKVLRNSLWFYKGLKEYTKSGFESASKKFNPADLEVNCNGQSFMITGANSGLGKQVYSTALRIPGEIFAMKRRFFSFNLGF